jgi:RimJ/RimL family protein N-acetyltransferase
MHEALQHLLDYLFQTLHLHRVEAEVDPRNQPSARVLERLGFQLEGVLRQRWRIQGTTAPPDNAAYLRAIKVTSQGELKAMQDAIKKMEG